MSEDKGQGLVELAGKYLSFVLADEQYGVDILNIQEIIAMMEVTAVPRTPDFVRGVINLRGKVISVIDLRSKFDMETCEDTDRTCIIVVQIDKEESDLTIGVVVDAVNEVFDIKAEQIEPAPSFGAVDTDFIMGMGKLDSRVVMLLDIHKILTGEELSALESIG